MRSVLVFHRPSPREGERVSGSTERPLHMLRAFERLGVEIITVDGYSRERRRKWRKVTKYSSSVRGLYSELSTPPLALSDHDHIPRDPVIDLMGFRSLCRAGVPISVFYRDIYWRFPFYASMLRWYKRWPTKCIHYLELLWLQKYVSHFYIPSRRMLEYFPWKDRMKSVSALPPGCEIRATAMRARGHGELNLFYVGGVIPPLYDISPMLRAASKVGGISLTICCRKNEWRAMSLYYGKGGNIHIVHRSGQDVDELFSYADVFLMYRMMDPYLRMAMPVKLFQALGHGVPVITNADCEMGDFVKENGVGWVVDTEVELTELLRQIRDRRSLVGGMKNAAEKKRLEHTWKDRAMAVLNRLDAQWSLSR